MIRTNGVHLCVESFGDKSDPAVLLIMGASASMLDWDEQFCQRLADAGRFVIRYDNRDTGRSTSYPPGAPPYTLRDLVADAVGLLDALDVPTAHLVGMSMGGAIAQLIALDYPQRVTTLTLLSSSPGGPGHPYDDLPNNATDNGTNADASPAEPNWADRAAVIEHYLAAYRPYAGSHGFDESAMRDRAARVVDRTTNMASGANHFILDPGEPWRDRLSSLRVPTLVLHGTEDHFLPLGHGIALAREIAGAEFVAMPRTGHEVPPHCVWDIVIPAIVRHTTARSSA
jgi:pimeloyl-ACP methyl ester carboxylesterase